MFTGATPFRMHGPLAVGDDGKPHFPYANPPRKPYNMADELRNNGFFVRLSDRYG